MQQHFDEWNEGVTPEQLDSMTFYHDGGQIFGQMDGSADWQIALDDVAALLNRLHQQRRKLLAFKKLLESL